MNTSIGLLLPSREVVCWSDGDLSRVVEAGKTAEQLGYDSVWVGDSLLARPRGEPFSLLSAIAAVTERVTVGTAVLLPLLRHPVILAHLAASVDRIAHGRLVLGVGPGTAGQATRAELRVVGVAAENRVPAMLGLLGEVRQLWRSDNATLHLEPSPQTPGGPPLWLGANGPWLIRRTGQQFDGWLPITGTPHDYSERWRLVRAAASEVGRDPDSVIPAMYLTVAVADTSQQAVNELDAYMQGYYGLPGDVMAKAQACHAGTLESASRWIGEYVAAGARHVVIRLAHPSVNDYDDIAAKMIGSLRGAIS